MNNEFVTYECAPDLPAWEGFLHFTIFSILWTMHFKRHPIKINCIKLSCHEHTVIFYVDMDYKNKTKQNKTSQTKKPPPKQKPHGIVKLYPDFIVCVFVTEGILLICDDCICWASDIFNLFLCSDCIHFFCWSVLLVSDAPFCTEEC